MNFKQYITENIDINDIIETLDRDCKPFLFDWKKLDTTKWLMSGRHISDFDNIAKKYVRQDRQPLDTPLEIHKVVDDWFQRKFGVRARSQSIFCTFNPNLATNFGKLMLVFPIGEYKVISSNQVEDLMLLFTESGRIINRSKSPIDKDTWKTLTQSDKDTVIDAILNNLDNSNYTTKLTFHNNEIMLICKSAYMVNSKHNGALLEHYLQ